ncbi:hypothetical protein [Pyrococcus kukulkanii]|uniref:Uncharacterized protein n=1 Tax=Pyrococcus kukulkanii TaxID=1609559 RepID=A0ABV4T5U6_9EURY
MNLLDKILQDDEIRLALETELVVKRVPRHDAEKRKQALKRLIEELLKHDNVKAVNVYSFQDTESLAGEKVYVVPILRDPDNDEAITQAHDKVRQELGASALRDIIVSPYLPVSEKGYTITREDLEEKDELLRWADDSKKLEELTNTINTIHEKVLMSSGGLTIALNKPLPQDTIEAEMTRTLIDIAWAVKEIERKFGKAPETLRGWVKEFAKATALVSEGRLDEALDTLQLLEDRITEKLKLLEGGQE